MEAGYSPLPTVVLTAEERDEAQRFIRSLAPDGQQLVVRDEIAEDFKRCMIAWSLIGSAERFVILRDWTSACTSAAKACSLYPCAIYFFDFASILRKAGKSAEAQPVFAEFLRRVAQPTNEIDEVVLAQRDIDGAIAEARQAVGRNT